MRSGHDVVFLENSSARAHLLNENGLRITKFGHDEVHLPVRVVTSVENQKPFDLVFVAVKTYQTLEAIELARDAQVVAEAHRAAPEVVVVARSQMDDSVALERNRPVPVQLQLVATARYSEAYRFAARAWARRSVRRRFSAAAFSRNWSSCCDLFAS